MGAPWRTSCSPAGVQQTIATEDRELPVAVHALILGVIVAVVSWPALPLLVEGGAILGHPVGDAADHYWGQAWLQEHVLQGGWPIQATGLFWPEHRSLWHADPVGAALSLPLAPLGPARAWNGLVLLQLGLLGLVGWGMGRDLGGGRRAGLVAATVLLCAPFLGGLLHGGLSEYFGLAPVVLGVWTLLRATGRDPRGRGPSLRWAAFAGLSLGLAGWQAAYYVLFLGLFALTCLVGSKPRARLLPTGLALGLGALITLPHALILRRFLDDSTSAVQAETAPGWAYTTLPGTDLLGFVAPFGYVHPDTPALGNPGILHVVALGWLTLGLALWALKTRPEARTLWLPTALTAVAMLGPRLVLAHRNIGLGGVDVPLPLALLYLPGSPFREVHHPYRLVALGLPLLALLAGIALARARKELVAVVVLGLLVDGLLLNGAPWPRATLSVAPPELYASLPEGAVLDWPADGTVGNRRYTAWQVSHAHPIPYGLNEFLDEETRADPLVRDLLRTLDEPADRARNRDQPARGPVVPRKAATKDSQLVTWGFRAIVVHPDLLSDKELARVKALLRARVGQPEEQAEGRLVYHLAPTADSGR